MQINPFKSVFFRKKTGPRPPFVHVRVFIVSRNVYKRQQFPIFRHSVTDRSEIAKKNKA